MQLSALKHYVQFEFNLIQNNILRINLHKYSLSKYAKVCTPFEKIQCIPKPPVASSPPNATYGALKNPISSVFDPCCT